jgi:hypothetical protein
LALPGALPARQLISIVIYLAELSASLLLNRHLEFSPEHSFTAILLYVCIFFIPFWGVTQALPWFQWRSRTGIEKVAPLQDAARAPRQPMIVVVAVHPGGQIVARFADLHPAGRGGLLWGSVWALAGSGRLRPAGQAVRTDNGRVAGPRTSLHPAGQVVSCTAAMGGPIVPVAIGATRLLIIT